MKIIDYKFNKNHLNSYVNLVDSLYKNHSYVNDFSNSIKYLLDNDNYYFKYASIKNFIVYDNNICLGHLTATIDSRLSNKIGLIGFFEATSEEIASKLLTKAIEWLKFKKVTEVRGPINLSIWHDYRFITAIDYKLDFLFEPYNLLEYSDYFKKFGFRTVEKYISGFRNEFSEIIKYTKSKYDNINNSNYSIRSINLKNLTNDLKIFHSLSLEIFKNSWSFIPISLEEFLGVYTQIEKIVNKRYCHFICQDDEEVGFCFSVEDKRVDQRTLVMKTIGVLPEYQKNNLGSALIYLQTKNALEDGFKRIIYALMRNNNIASNINPYDAKVFKKYEVYSLDI